MAKPQEFDRDVAVERAMSVFWSNGYAATSTDDLLQMMKNGRQVSTALSARQGMLYVEALERNQQESVAGRIKRLRSIVAPRRNRS